MTQQSHYWAYTEKTIVPKDTHAAIFIVALFTIAYTWKQSKCPSTEEWIRKMWYIGTMEYYSAIKRNKTGLYIETWMDLQTVIRVKSVRKRKTNIMQQHVFI